MTSADRPKAKRGRPPNKEPEENGVDILFRKLNSIETKLDILIQLTQHQTALEAIIKRVKP